MKVTGAWIEAKPTQALCAILEDAGHQALFVGGCVRNALMGVAVGDIDIATDARPEVVMALTEGAGMKAVPTGIDHGTVTVVSETIPHEVTTFRQDVETFGRHAVISYADDVHEDARRRDFTMNALYARADGELIDPLGGLADLQARHVRFIEDPVDRIKEDYLRILRFFRFTAWYGDPDAGIDAEGLAACADLAEGLNGLSRERVGAEMVKLLQAPDPAPAIASMRQAGVLSRVLPGAEDRALAPLIDLEGSNNLAPDAMRRLAAIGAVDAEDRLRLSKAQARKLVQLRGDACGTMRAGELGYRRGASAGRDALILRAALLEEDVNGRALTEIDLGAKSEFPVRAKDLMGELRGPSLGSRLKALEQTWIDSGFTLNREDLLRSGRDQNRN